MDSHNTLDPEVVLRYEREYLVGRSRCKCSRSRIIIQYRVNKDCFRGSWIYYEILPVVNFRYDIRGRVISDAP
jgi:hypothetical protein